MAIFLKCKVSEIEKFKKEETQRICKTIQKENFKINIYNFINFLLSFLSKRVSFSISI